MRKSISLLLSLMLTLPNVALANGVGGGGLLYNPLQPGASQCGYPSEEGGAMSEDEEKLELMREQLERVEDQISAVEDRVRDTFRDAKRVLNSQTTDFIRSHASQQRSLDDYGPCEAPVQQQQQSVPCVDPVNSATPCSRSSTSLEDEYEPTILEIFKYADAKEFFALQNKVEANRMPATGGAQDNTRRQCPAGSTGTHPNCTCTDARKIFDLEDNACVNRPTARQCPSDASGTHPNCTCLAPKVYSAATNTCDTARPAPAVTCNTAVSRLVDGRCVCNAVNSTYNAADGGSCQLTPVTQTPLDPIRSDCAPGRPGCPQRQICRGFSNEGETPPTIFCAGGCPSLLNIYFGDDGEVNAESLCNTRDVNLLKDGNITSERREDCVSSVERSVSLLRNLKRLKERRRTLSRKISEAESCLMDQELDDLLSDNSGRSSGNNRRSCVGNTEGGRRSGRGGDRSRLGGWELAGMVGMGLAGIAASYYGTRHIVNTNTQLGWPNDPYMAQMPWHIAAQGMYGIALGNQIRGGYGCVGGGLGGPGGAFGYPGGMYGQSPYGGIMMGGPFGGMGGYPGMGGGAFMGGGMFMGGGIYAGGGMYPGGYMGGGGFPGGMYAGGGVFAGGGIYAGGGMFPGGYMGGGGFPGGMYAGGGAFAGGGIFAGGGVFQGGFSGLPMQGGFPGGGMGYPGGGGGYMGAEFQLQMMQQYQQQLQQYMQQEQARVANQMQAQQTVQRLTQEMTRIQQQILQISYGAQYGIGTGGSYSTGSGNLLTNPLDPTAPIGR